MPYPTRASVQRIADAIAQALLDPALSAAEALDRSDADTACEVLLGAAVAGRPVDPQLAARALPDLSDLSLLPILVGACGGEQVEMLLDCVEQDRMSSERDAVALFLAVELLGGKPPPARLVTLLRMRARRGVGIESSILLGMAARTLGDPHLLEVAKAWLPMATVVEARPLRERLLRLLSGPPLEVLPERPPPRVVSGFTVRRAVPKVSRNDPCPCRSGKKYKRCCESKDSERAADPSPQAGLTRLEYLRLGGAKIGPDEIRDLRPAELAQLDLATLATLPLIAAMRRLSAFQRWDLAERAMEALASRTDAPDGDDGDGYRSDLISDAVRAGNLEVAERQLGLLRDRTAAVPSDILALKLRRRSEGTLAFLEEMAVAGLREPGSHALLDLAVGLLPSSPALGIVAARAALNVERSLDAAMLLDAIEEARDRLGLPPGDPSREGYEQLLDRELGRRLEEAATRKESARSDRLADEAEGLRAKLHESRARIADLELGLRAQEASLTRLPRPSTSAPAPAAPPPTSSPIDEAERRRLRAKVDELKQLLSERNRERAELRRELTRVSDALASDAAEAASAPETDDGEDREEVESAPMDPPRAVLFPCFSAAAREALGSLPAAVAGKALVILASLAAGEPAAWRQVKRMVAAASPLLSCRVGIHHRALFRIDQGELTTLTVIHRKDLDAAIRRHGR